jgi:hypothetical protein
MLRTKPSGTAHSGRMLKKYSSRLVSEIRLQSPLHRHLWYHPVGVFDLRDRHDNAFLLFCLMYKR